LLPYICKPIFDSKNTFIDWYSFRGSEIRLQKPVTEGRY
jgi:hypothetical protein